MDFELASVLIDQIDLSDSTYELTTSKCSTDLALSVSAVGLLQPPILIAESDGFVVVCGFRRIAACASLKLAHVPARILPPGHSRLACAKIAIADNAFQRELNVVEQSRAFAMIRRYAGERQTWMSLARSVGLPDSPAVMDRLLDVADMPEILQQSILDGHISLPVAIEINRLNSLEAAVLIRLFDSLNTGLNIQRELLETIREISLRDGISLAELLEKSPVASILHNDELSNPQRVQELRRQLKRMRYPELSKAETRFQQLLRSARLDSRIQFQHPPFFEGKTYRATLSIDSRTQLRHLISELEKLASHPDLLPD